MDLKDIIQVNISSLLMSVNECEAVFISIYSVFSTITGLAGNLLVLLATYEYQSFDVDLVTVFFIRHLSLSDIFYIVTSVVPWAITSFFRAWVLGKVICYLVGMAYVFCSVANMGFIVTVSAHRLGRCIFPLRLSWMTQKKALVLVSFVWLIALTESIIIGINGSPIVYEPTVTFCFPSPILHIGSVMDFTKDIYVSLIVTGFVLMFVLNLLILVQARRSTERLSLVAIRTVCLMCGTFTIGYIATLIKIVLTHFYPGETFVILQRLARYLFVLTTFCNPLIYTMTNNKFKWFLIKKVRSICHMRQINLH